MDVKALALDKAKARELYREYKKHQNYSSPIDHEIQRTCQLIAQGRTVIQAIESIKAAGLNEEGFPKLAIARATQERCFLRLNADGSAEFRGDVSLDIPIYLEV